MMGASLAYNSLDVLTPHPQWWTLMMIASSVTTWCIDFTQVEHRIHDLLWYETGRAHVSEMSWDITSNKLVISYLQSASIKNTIKTQALKQVLQQHFQLHNQWDLSLSPSLNFHWLLSTSIDDTFLLCNILIDVFLFRNGILNSTMKHHAAQPCDHWHQLSP
jgi:hypothetical protein